jgi:hypothetical protein
METKHWTCSRLALATAMDSIWVPVPGRALPEAYFLDFSVTAGDRQLV